jgi:hypothetical protein
MLPEQKRHEMVLERTHESGAEEWYCPVCGRRFLMQWPPNYKKIIIEPGDEYAIHSGGKGGLPGIMKLGMNTNISHGTTDTPELEDDLGLPEVPVPDEDLISFEDWMNQVNFDKLWGDE